MGGCEEQTRAGPVRQLRVDFLNLNGSTWAGSYRHVGRQEQCYLENGGDVGVDDTYMELLEQLVERDDGEVAPETWTASNECLL